MMPYKQLWRKPNLRLANFLVQYSSQFRFSPNLQQLSGLMVCEKLIILKKCKIL